MTKDNWFLYGVLGLIGYYLYTRSTATAQSYPPSSGWPNQAVTPGRQPTGSGGVTAGGGSSNPLPGGRIPPDGNVPTGSGGVVATGDSMDPCDPSSTSYDPDICANLYVQQQAALPSGDSGDPCDPSSIAYDAGICAESTGIASTDGFNDPYLGDIGQGWGYD